MPQYLSPGVYVEEFDSGPSPIQGVGTSVAGFVGVSERGPTIGAPTLVTSVAEFTRKFGSYLQTNEFGDYRFLAHAVNHFFLNGGAKAYIVRVAPSDAKFASFISKDKSIKITAKSSGIWGNSITITFENENENKTQITKDLGEGRYKLKNVIGFDLGDVVILDQGEKTSQVSKITNVAQKVITVEAPFKGEVVDQNLIPKITIKTSEINLNIECDGMMEQYENVSFNIFAPSYVTKKLSKSEIVEIEIETKTHKENISYYEFIKKALGTKDEESKIKISLSGGSNGSSANLTDSDFIGKDEGPGQRTGIQSFLDNNDINIVAIPGIVSPNIQLSLVSHCEKLGSRFAVLDVPFTAKTPSDVLNHRNIVDSDYCAMYHPWLKVFDPLDKKDVFIPPSGSVLGIYARSDESRGVHKAPANEVVANCTGLSVYYNAAEQDFLNPKGMNAIRKFPGAGIRVWGARTASSKPLWRYINVRRLFIYVEESIKANTNWVVFEPNDQKLWSRVKATIETFLSGIWTSGALVGSSPDEAYFVDIGANTMTKDDIDNGRLICLIGIAPVKPAEFIIFRITQKTAE
ncbi:MAG: phage tail sheath subtilisin-like domain-containing protein [Candidatus Improbicoccus pseudotrichonymphae]|uniref:Phage tail sheath subtilisin-like domain-containing protein n=1 Tax=Candidatus Improbicoccus pseudotrichonymphae TaxID=3033792 RepID=A0AA48I1N5_9FIRM|nr:MAG: phage tail sheath subtilisin-like domain-containing protein [Candidatus Improbicoccus pseudotrichonymphae]